MRIGVVIPTIPGREKSLTRCIDAYRAHTEGVELVFSIHEDSPSAGEGWLQGAKTLEDGYGELEYLHLTNDDCAAADDDWWRDCIEACDAGKLPCPIILNSDLSLQSAGGQLGAPDDLIRDIGGDWAEVGFTTVPFMSWEQWKAIGMLPIHYCSDVWISHRGGQLGYPTVLRHRFRLIHHMHPIGRAGQHERARRDRMVMEEALEEAVCA